MSLGKYAKIALVIDNAPWHNELTNDSIPPKRSWWKENVKQCLDTHNITVLVRDSKAELFEIVMKNLPEQRYETDEAAKNYNVHILR